MSTIRGLPLYVAYTSDTIKVGEKYDWMCFFGYSLPHYSMLINLTEYEKKNKNNIFAKSISSDKSVTTPVFSRKYMRSGTYQVPGNYHWLLQYCMIDSKRKCILSDSMQFDITVTK
jgi:hypothetical protein